MGEEGGYDETSRTGRLLVKEWCREVDSLEKKTLMREGHSRPRAPLHNWKMLKQCELSKGVGVSQWGKGGGGMVTSCSCPLTLTGIGICVLTAQQQCNMQDQ